MPKEPYFGGKAPAKKIWTPLPLMDVYLDTLREEKPESYVKVVDNAFSYFAEFAKLEDLKHPDEIERKHLSRFDAWLREQVTWRGNLLADSTRAILLNKMKTWVAWCFKNGYLAQDPWAMIKISNPRRKKPRPFQTEELTRIFEAHKKAAFSTAPFFYHRRDVLLALLYGWGLRPNEIVNLTVTAMDARLNEVLVKKASGLTKSLPYGNEMKGIVQRWLRVRGAKARRGEDALLIDQEGHPMTELMIGKILKDLGGSSGVDLSATRFRENFSAIIVEQGLDIEQVAKMLGLNDRQARRISADHDEELKESYDYIIDPLMGRYFGGKA